MEFGEVWRDERGEIAPGERKRERERENEEGWGGRGKEAWWSGESERAGALCLGF